MFLVYVLAPSARDRAAEFAPNDPEFYSCAEICEEFDAISANIYKDECEEAATSALEILDYRAKFADSLEEEDNDPPHCVVRDSLNDRIATWELLNMPPSNINAE